MASFQNRPRGDGSIAHRAIIRIKQDGKVVHTESHTFDHEKTARRWAALREAELDKPGVLAALRQSGDTVGDLIRRYISEFDVANQFGRSKLHDLKRLLNTDLAEKVAVDLRSSDVIDYIRYRRDVDGVGPATANNDVVWLRVVLQAARPAWGIDVNLQHIDDAAVLLRKNRMIGRPKSRDRRPELHELDKILDYLDDRDGRATIPMVDITLFALFSSRRESEICRIEWADLDIQRQTVLVRDMKHPRSKDGNHTLVHLTDSAMAVISRQPKNDARIFPYNPKSVSAAFTRACNFLEIDDLRFHDLRHECVSWLFERGFDIPRVAQHSGHKSWSALQGYTHLRERGEFDKYADWRWLPGDLQAE